MNKAAPSLPRIIVMVVFALSCFGLLLFLWLSFGGPVPLKPKGYQVKIDFPEATTLAQEADVRVAGVPVGKVRKVEVGDGTNRTVASVELADSQVKPTVQLDEIFDSLDPATRDAFKGWQRELAVGIKGRGRDFND